MRQVRLFSRYINVSYLVLAGLEFTALMAAAYTAVLLRFRGDSVALQVNMQGALPAFAGFAITLGLMAFAMPGILGNRADLRLRVVAGYESRLDRLQERANLSRAETRALLKETDESRMDFIGRIYGATPGLPQNFDVTLNTDRLAGADLADLALTLLIARSSDARPAKLLEANAQPAS